MRRLPRAGRRPCVASGRRAGWGASSLSRFQSREILAGQQSRSDKLRPVDAGGRLLEVQTVDAADSIAYNAHDADDAVELGMIEIEELDASAVWRSAAANARMFSPIGLRMSTTPWPSGPVTILSM